MLIWSHFEYKLAVLSRQLRIKAVHAKKLMPRKKMHATYAILTHNNCKFTKNVSYRFDFGTSIQGCFQVDNIESIV